MDFRVGQVGPVSREHSLLDEPEAVSGMSKAAVKREWGVLVVSALGPINDCSVTIIPAKALSHTVGLAEKVYKHQSELYLTRSVLVFIPFGLKAHLSF